MSPSNVNGVEYVKSKTGSYEISFVNTDKKPDNYESIFIKQTNKPDGTPVEHPVKHALEKLSNITEEYQLPDKSMAVSDTKSIILKNGSFCEEIKDDEPLFNFLNAELQSPKNNTKIKPAENVFIPAESNSKVIEERKDGLHIVDRKPVQRNTF